MPVKVVLFSAMVKPSKMHSFSSYIEILRRAESLFSCWIGLPPFNGHSMAADVDVHRMNSSFCMSAAGLPRRAPISCTLPDEAGVRPGNAKI